MYSLSLAAMEEASRLGSRDADLEHLLLALATSEQEAGQVLRGAGVSLERTRGAIADQHAEQLEALGVAIDRLEPGPIVFHETGGYEWTDRAQLVFRRSNSRGADGSATAVLRELLAEPSGLVSGILSRMGVSEGEILARLDSASRIPSFGGGRKGSRDVLQQTASSFVPAPMGDVWALLVDPERMQEWDDLLGRVALPESLRGRAPGVGDSWEGMAATHAPDGRPIKIRPMLRRSRIELIACEEPHLISWRLSYPDEPRANSRRVTIGLAPSAGGTQLATTFAWEPTRRRRMNLLRFVLRPAARFAIWLQVSRVGSGISRVFRSGSA